MTSVEHSEEAYVKAEKKPSRSKSLFRRLFPVGKTTVKPIRIGRNTSIFKPRKETYWLLFAALLFSIGMRWPLTTHETGIDSFYIHGLATSISDLGEIGWSATILSYFGLYPLSYPSGIPTLLSEFSQMTGIALEATVLIFSFLCGIVATISSFALALEIRRSPLFALVISMAYSVSPLILFWSLWTITTRGLFMAILPIIILLLIKIEKQARNGSDIANRYKLIFLLVLTLILMALTHKLIFMIGLFIIAYFVAKATASSWVKRKLTESFGPLRNPRMERLVEASLIMSAVSIAAVIAYSAGWFGLETYEVGIFSGESDFIRVLNMIASAAVTVGFPLALLVPVGLLITIYTKKKGFLEIFFITSFLIILPFSGGRAYERFFYPLVSIVLAYMPLFLMREKSKRGIYRKILIVAFVATLPMNMVIVDLWNQWPETKVIDDGVAVSDETYMTSLFLSHQFEGQHFMGTNWIANLRIQAISSNPELPNALSPTYTNNILVYGVIDEDNLTVTKAPLSDLLTGKGSIFLSDWTWLPERDWSLIMATTQYLGVVNSTLHSYDVSLLVEDQRLNGKVTGWLSYSLYPRGDYTSGYLNHVHEEMFKIYDNGRESVWLLTYGA